MPMTKLEWQLGGRLSVHAEGLDADQQRFLAAELDPFTPLPAGAGGADVSLLPLDQPLLDELHGPAKDGLTTGRDRDGRLLARYGDRWAEVPAPDARPLHIGLQPGLPLGACWAEVVRPALHQAVRSRGAVAVHAAAVDGGPLGSSLLCGWSESGKTEVALALVEAGAGFLSDKWTIASADGELSAFPVGVGVRGWALDALPRLRHALPSGALAQLTAAQHAGRLLRPALDRPWTGRVSTRGARAVQRAVQLGDRASLSVSALRRAYGQVDDPARTVALGTVVLLVTGPTDRVAVVETTPEEAAKRLARAAVYERRVYYDLQDRGAYAGLPGRAGAREKVVAEETAVLARAFSEARRVVEVSCPFPGDPRRVLDALTAGT